MSWFYATVALLAGQVPSTTPTICPGFTKRKHRVPEGSPVLSGGEKLYGVRQKTVIRKQWFATTLGEKERLEATRG